MAADGSEEHKDWEHNEKKRYKFHMNLYETWIYYDFFSPLSACLYAGRKKIQIIFAEALKGCSRATLETTARQVW